MWYWLVESQNNAKTDPVVLWLTGGPGCSAGLASFLENGPFTVAPGGQSLLVNPWSWNRNATVLYVDSPVGTGYSYTNASGLVTSEKQMADDLYTLLQSVWANYPEINQGQPMYVFAESYGGHYAFAISERIVLGNKKRSPGTIQLPLTGVAVGNGMTFPLLQYSKYSAFSLAHGLISHQVAAQLDVTYASCQQALTSAWSNASDICNSILDTVQTVGGNFNVYDVTRSCLGDLCYPQMADVATYLNLPAVFQAFQVSSNVASWQSCNGPVYNAIATPDWFLQEQYVVPFLLDQMRVLIYNGVNDWVSSFPLFFLI